MSPPDLLAIVQKAMARDPDHRYGSGQELAAELRRFQTGRMVAAKHYSVADRTRRWVYRHRAPVLVALVAAAIVVSMSVVGLRRIVTERDRARAEEARATARADDLTLAQSRAWLGRDPARAISLLSTLSPKSTRWHAARTIAADALSRGIPRVLRGHEGRVLHAVTTSDGKLIATASADRTVRVWDLATGRNRVFEGHLSIVVRLAVSPDDRVVASAGHDGSVRLHDIESGETQVLHGHAGEVHDVAFDPSGRYLASAGQDGTVRLWRDRAPYQELRGHQGSVGHVAFSVDGTRVISGGNDGTARVWSIDGEIRRVHQAHRGPVTRLVVTPAIDGFISAGDDGRIRLFHDNGPEHVFEGHDERIFDVAVSPDGTRLASGGNDRTVRIHRLDGGGGFVLKGHERTVSSVAFSEDGQHLVSGSHDGTVRVWDLQRGGSRVLRGHDYWVYHVTTRPDLIVSTGADRTVRLWTYAGDRSLALSAHQHWVSELAFGSSGRTLSSVDEEGRLCLWSIPEGELLRTEVLTGAFKSLSPDGRRALSVGIDGSLYVTTVDRDRRVDLPPLQGHASDVLGAVFSADGTQAASAGGDGEIRVWNLGSGKGRLLSEPCRGASDLSFSPDGRRLAVGGGDFALHLYDLPRGGHQAYQGHRNVITQLTFAPDGQRLASCSIDRTARVWNLENGRSVRVPGHDGTINHVAFSPDSQTLASAGSDRVVRLLDLETDRSRPLTGHLDMVWFVSFSPDGVMLASGSSDETVRLWDTSTGESRSLDGHKQRVWRAVFSPDGRLVASARQGGDPEGVAGRPAPRGRLPPAGAPGAQPRTMTPNASIRSG